MRSACDSRALVCGDARLSDWARQVLCAVQRRPTCGRGEGATVLYVGLARRRRQGATRSFGWRARTVSSVGRLHLQLEGGANKIPSPSQPHSVPDQILCVYP